MMADASAPTSYIDGKPTDARETHHHLTPMSTYWRVFGLLMVLTVVTVAISYMGLGEASIFVALAVALVKAGVVAAYFMHLKSDDKFHTFVFMSTILFVSIFFILTMADISTRDAIVHEWDNHQYQLDNMTEAQLEERERVNNHEIMQHPPGAGDGKGGHH